MDCMHKPMKGFIRSSNWRQTARCCSALALAMVLVRTPTRGHGTTWTSSSLYSYTMGMLSSIAWRDQVRTPAKHWWQECQMSALGPLLVAS